MKKRKKELIGMFLVTFVGVSIYAFLKKHLSPDVMAHIHKFFVLYAILLSYQILCLRKRMKKKGIDIKKIWDE